MTDSDFQIMQKYQNSSMGKYILKEIKNNGGFNPTLTDLLKKYFNQSVDGSTYRESFISVLVSIIGCFDVLNGFLSKYGGEYQIVTDTRDIPKYDGNFCVYSGDSITHYISHTQEGGVYDPYDLNHQIPYSDGFCQTFSVYNVVGKCLTEKQQKYNMIPYDYVNNSFKAFRFISVILNDNRLKNMLNTSINEVYEKYVDYDLNPKPRLTLTSIKKILRLFNKVDIYTLILFSAEDIGMSDENIEKFMLVN